MTRGKQTTALALAGAVALASGAYALGTQVDGGAAEAAKSSDAGPRGFGPRGFGGPGRPGIGHRFGLDNLATRLGVEEDKLRSALEDIAKTHRQDFAQRLADALKIDRAKVEQAFENIRPKRPDRPRAPRALAAALAKELGIPVAKVRAALNERRGHPSGPSDLAQDLGVSEEKLREAFHAVMGKIRPRGPSRPGLSNLAKELGVTQAQLEAAFDKLRDDHEQLREDFAQELAQRLGIDVAKVQDALDDFRPFGRRHP